MGIIPYVDRINATKVNTCSNARPCPFGFWAMFTILTMILVA